MFNSYRVVVVTSAKTARCLALLKRYLTPHTDLIDAWHIYVPGDISHYEFARIHQATVRLEEWAEFKSRIKKPLASACIDDQTIYIRLDDDICYMREDSLKELLSARVQNLECLLVWPAIIGCGRTLYVHQTMGKANGEITGGFKSDQIDSLDLRSYPKDASTFYHQDVLPLLETHKSGELLFGKLYLTNYEQISLSGSCWFGEAMMPLLARCGQFNDEEHVISSIFPHQMQIPCLIWGKSLMAVCDNLDLPIRKRYEIMAGGTF